MAYFAGAARFLLLTAVGITGNPSTADAASASPVSGWRSDLDWAALTSELSSSASLIDTTYDNYKEECFPEFSEPSPTNHALIDQPSGMCLPHLYLGWEMSWPRPSENGHLDQTYDQAAQDLTDGSLESWLVDPTNPSLNLPSKVLFPSIASDVVAAVNFAKEHGLEISVKNSGHSYQGASSKKDTLLLNMNRYTHYAPTGITDCDASILGITVAEDLSSQPCLLSLAKNKSSLIRVGGGENFDKVYRAVIAANEEEGYKYHVVGGGAGTVSPMGWSWQGGLAGSTGGRLDGFGVDQVVQLEMVLPNGVHVKFGPTEWEDVSAKGFIVPRTKVVSGVCRSNPDEHDEENWVWERCPEDFDTDFNDLWFAVRGGGGGTWGVVTSVFLQLHDYLPVTPYFFNLVPSPTEECSAIAPQFAEFKAQYISAPSLLNVTKEHSLACGSADTPSEFWCYGEEDVMQAWTRFLDRNNLTDPANVACLSGFPEIAGYAEGQIYLASNDRMPGKVPDSPAPMTIGPYVAGVLVPQSWFDESEKNRKTIQEYAKNAPYYAFGGATASGSDQANSLSQAHRNAAFMTYFSLEDFWGNLFPQMFDVSDKTNFPPVFGSNHAGFLTAGPLKEDWTKPCPPEWTFEERREKCISFQEAIYGTEQLARLEAIKKAVDPQFIFNCVNCIGNNLPEASKSEDDEPSPAEAEPLLGNSSDEPSGASFVSSFVAAISAAAVYLLIHIM
ncbi:FAD-dependent oxidoreductase [Skeletonema marinoi]|uniref:FAD-dependent oxidoreductase n=1 Tax=Skeletonema marinoi TaxID=267567 RepID=A0AAD8YHX8_9STRA|nr:FAD-dependent oxidoreductase [Skeletonema marinoi]